MAVIAIAVATGDIIKYQSFVYGSFVWGIQVRYNKRKYSQYYSEKFFLNEPMLIQQIWMIDMRKQLEASPDDVIVIFTLIERVLR